MLAFGYSRCFISIFDSCVVIGIDRRLREYGCGELAVVNRKLETAFGIVALSLDFCGSRPLRLYLLSAGSSSVLRLNPPKNC